MITLDITPEGGEAYRLVAKTRHVVAWERLGKGRSLSRLQAPTLTDLAEIAHVTAVREGKFSGSFDNFLDGNEVSAVDPNAPAGDDEESGPTHPAP